MRAQDYAFNLIYEPGTGNIADGLSRLPVSSPATEVKFVEEHVNFVKKDSTLLSIEEIQESGKKDTIKKGSDRRQRGMEQVGWMLKAMETAER